MGSALADMAARAEVGELILVDPETLEPSNLKRHVLTDAYIGFNKAESMKQHLEFVNETLPVSAIAGKFDSFVKDLWEADVIACCADSEICCQQVNAYALEKKIPAVFGGVHGDAHTAEIITVTGTPCYACFEREGPLPESGQEKYTNPNYDATKAPHQEGLWADVIMAASLQFRAIIGLAGGGKFPPMVLKSLRYPYKLESFHPERGCAVCAENFTSLSV